VSDGGGSAGNEVQYKFYEGQKGRGHKDRFDPWVNPLENLKSKEEERLRLNLRRSFWVYIINYFMMLGYYVEYLILLVFSQFVKISRSIFTVSTF